MQITCSYSGLVFPIAGFGSLSLDPRRGDKHAVHPIFLLSSDYLLSEEMISTWRNGHLSPKESYLYLLSTLNASGMISFHCPAKYEPDNVEQSAIIYQSQERVLFLLSKQLSLPSAANTSIIFPRIAISAETATLASLPDWLDVWDSALAAFINAYRSVSLTQKILNRETSLERLLKSPSTPSHLIASQLSEWAALAGAFPFTQTQYIESQKKEMTLGDYWKLIIKACANEEKIWYIPKPDLEELITHCEENIPHGSIYSSALMRALRAGRDAQSNFLGLGEIDLSPVSNACAPFRILTAETSKEDANKLAAIETAPATLPIRKDYPNDISFLRAKLKYDMAAKYRQQLEQEAARQNAINSQLETAVNTPIDSTEEIENANEPTFTNQYAVEPSSEGARNE